MPRSAKVEFRPFELYSKLIRAIRFCCRFVGADVLDPNYKINLISVLVAIFIFGYFVCTFYTIFHVFAEKWTILLEALCMAGSALQGMVKYATAIKCKNSYRKMDKFLLETYGEYQEKGDKYNKALTKCIRSVRSLVISLAILYIFLALCLVSVPIWYLIFTNQRLLIMQFQIPGIDVKTANGHLLTLGIHIICVYMGTFGNFVADSMTVVNFYHLRIFVYIFKLKVAALNEFVEDNDMRSSPKTKQLLIEVITWHQEYSSFTDTCNSTFHWNIATQVLTSGFSMILTLGMLFIGGWPSGYSYLIYCFICLYLYCVMGTIVEICNDNFTTEIYEINWYNLSVPDQKMVRIMLMRSQSPITVTVLGVMPLSVSTALQVTKTVYSVFMMLVNFF